MLFKRQIKILMRVLLFASLISSTGCLTFWNFVENYKGSGLVWQKAMIEIPNDITVTYIGRYNFISSSLQDFEQRQMHVMEMITEASETLAGARPDVRAQVYRGKLPRNLFSQIGDRINRNNKKWASIASKSKSDWLIICSFVKFPTYRRMSLQPKAQLLVEVYVCDRNRKYKMARKPIFYGFPLKKEFVHTAGGNGAGYMANTGNRAQMMQGLMNRVSIELARMFYEHKRRPVYRRAPDIYGR